MLAMAAQELQDARDTGATADATREADLDRQGEILMERKVEIDARHPNKAIAVCGEEVFVGDSDDEVVSRARAAHPGRPYFLRQCPQESGRPEDAGAAEDEVDAAFEEDLARQERIFMDRIDELLARYPDKFIAVCGGEVFVGKDDGEAASKARAAHPGRPFFMRLYDPCRRS